MGGAFGPSTPNAVVGGGVSDSRGPVGNVSSVGNATLVAMANLSVINIVNMGHHVFATLTGRNVSMFVISRTSSRGSASVNMHRRSMRRTMGMLGHRFRGRVTSKTVCPVRTRAKLTAVTVINRGVGRTTNVTNGLFNALNEDNVSIVTYTRNTSRAGVSFIIGDSCLEGSLGMLRSDFFLSRCGILGLFVYNMNAMNKGLVRRVGGRSTSLVRHDGLGLGIINVTSSGGTVFGHRKLSLRGCRTRLGGSLPDAPRLLHSAVLTVGVFGDMFMSYATDGSITTLCRDLLRRGMDIVTTGGVTTSDRCRGCRGLGGATVRHNMFFHFRAGINTNLPVVKAVGSLQGSKSGVLGVRTILSKALGFVFGTVSKIIPFSRAIGLTGRGNCDRPSPHVSLDNVSIVEGLIVLSHRTKCHMRRRSMRGGLFMPGSFFGNDVSRF